MKNCEKNESETRIKKREATLNISNDNPGILTAEKKTKKEYFLHKISWITGLTIRNVVLAQKL
jgi:hypothetical protein